MKKTVYCLYLILILILILLLYVSPVLKGQSVPAGARSGMAQISDDAPLTLVQYRTFQYFWDGAEPKSGMDGERYHVDGIYSDNDMNIVTSGGTGFGVMAIL